MLAYDLFLLSLATLYGFTTFLLAVLGAYRWDLYFSLYLIEYLALGTVAAFLSTRARRVLDGVAYILLPGFGAVLALKVAGILWGSTL